MSWIGSSTASSPPIEITRIERRLRTEADPRRAPLPRGLQQRTLNALRDIEPAGRPRDSFRQPSMVMSLASFATILVVIVAGSLLASRPTAPSPTPELARNLTVPSARDLNPRAILSIKTLETLTGINMDEKGTTDPFLQEARLFMKDASRAASAVLASMPRQFPQPRNPQSPTPDGGA